MASPSLSMASFLTTLFLTIFIPTHVVGRTIPELNGRPIYVLPTPSAPSPSEMMPPSSSYPPGGQLTYPLGPTPQSPSEMKPPSSSYPPPPGGQLTYPQGPTPQSPSEMKPPSSSYPPEAPTYLDPPMLSPYSPPSTVPYYEPSAAPAPMFAYTPAEGPTTSAPSPTSG